MDTVGKRIAYLIDSKGLNRSEFCERYDFIYASFSRVITDTNPLGMNILNKLMEVFPNLNINWLLYGEGNINYDNNIISEDINVLREPSEVYGQSTLVKLFIEQLDNKEVRKKLKEVLKEINNSTKFGNNADNLVLKISESGENSELIDRLDKMIDKDTKTP